MLSWWLDRDAKEQLGETDELFLRIVWIGLQ